MSHLKQTFVLAFFLCFAVWEATSSPPGSGEDDDDEWYHKSTPASNSSTVSGGKTKPSPAPKECGRTEVESMPKCCKLPQPFPTELIDACTFVATTPKPAKGKKSGNQSKQRKTRDTKSKGKKHHYTCIAECILKNLTLINATGDIDIKALGNLILGNSSEAWQPIVKEVVPFCWAELTGVNGAIPPPPKGACKSKADMMLMCVMRGLTMQCPASEASTDTKCKESTKKLKGCDPYAAAKKNKKPNNKG